jgi:hypothetical protein
VALRARREFRVPLERVRSFEAITAQRSPQEQSDGRLWTKIRMSRALRFACKDAKIEPFRCRSSTSRKRRPCRVVRLTGTRSCSVGPPRSRGPMASSSSPRVQLRHLRGAQERDRLSLSRVESQGGRLRELWLRHGCTRRPAAARNGDRSDSRAQYVRRMRILRIGCALIGSIPPRLLHREGIDDELEHPPRTDRTWNLAIIRARYCGLVRPT